MEKVAVDEEEGGGRKMRADKKILMCFGEGKVWEEDPCPSLLGGQKKPRGIVQIISYPLPWRGILSPASFAHLF